jgi:sulfate adenylyltransferase subunit 2
MRRNYLKQLESEAIFVLREAAAQFEKPVVLFSGGKDSICLAHLARKAFLPAKIPFPFLHIDTGHNFPELIEFRDNFIHELGAQLIIRYVQDSIDAGKVQEKTGDTLARNSMQIVTLQDALEEFSFDAACCGARRDDEKSRAKERIFSFRNRFGHWEPKNQRPEIWNIFNTQKNSGEHFRVFPLSNWTELDLWRYITLEQISMPSLYFAHEREIIEREGILLAVSPFLHPQQHEKPNQKKVRFRTIGDMTCTGAVESEASNIIDIIQELTDARSSERSSRYDDRQSETAMENRKQQGYF